jgi:hypothetical protein
VIKILVRGVADRVAIFELQKYDDIICQIDYIDKIDKARQISLSAGLVYPYLHSFIIKPIKFKPIVSNELMRSTMGIRAMRSFAVNLFVLRSNTSN